MQLLGRAIARLAWPGARAHPGLAGPGRARRADDLLAYDVAMLGRLPHQRWLARAQRGRPRRGRARACASTQAGTGATRPLGQLSGGERQRVLLARALAVEAAGAADGRAAGQPRCAAPGRLAACACARWSPPAAPWSACCTNSAWRSQADELLVLAGGRVMHQAAPAPIAGLRHRARCASASSTTAIALAPGGRPMVVLVPQLKRH